MEPKLFTKLVASFPALVMSRGSELLRAGRVKPAGERFGRHEFQVDDLSIRLVEVRIDPAYLTEPSDLEAMVAGVRHARRIAASTSLREIGSRELIPGPLGGGYGMGRRVRQRQRGVSRRPARSARPFAPVAARCGWRLGGL